MVAAVVVGVVLVGVVLVGVVSVVVSCCCCCCCCCLLLAVVEHKTATELTLVNRKPILTITRQSKQKEQTGDDFPTKATTIIINRGRDNPPLMMWCQMLQRRERILVDCCVFFGLLCFFCVCLLFCDDHLLRPGRGRACANIGPSRTSK